MTHHNYNGVCIKEKAFTFAKVLSPHPTCQRKHAFTLAEVLITLGIIGVVAALTIPNLIANYREKETITKLKKAYSDISQVYEMVMVEYGGPVDLSRAGTGVSDDDWAIVDTFASSFKKYYRKLTECGSKENYSEGNGRCYIKGYYKTLYGKDYTYGYGTMAGKGFRSFVTPDGMIIGLAYDGIWGLGEILVDINGQQKPNRYGYDAFAFQILNDKIIPRGGKCSVKRDGANDNRPNGMGCTYWIIQHENLDFQKCVKGMQSFCNTNYNVITSDNCDPDTDTNCINR